MVIKIFSVLMVLTLAAALTFPGLVYSADRGDAPETEEGRNAVDAEFPEGGQDRGPGTMGGRAMDSITSDLLQLSGKERIDMAANGEPNTTALVDEFKNFARDGVQAFIGKATAFINNGVSPLVINAVAQQAELGNEFRVNVIALADTNVLRLDTADEIVRNIERQNLVSIVSISTDARSKVLEKFPGLTPYVDTSLFFDVTSDESIIAALQNLFEQQNGNIAACTLDNLLPADRQKVEGGV